VIIGGTKFRWQSRQTIIVVSAPLAVGIGVTTLNFNLGAQPFPNGRGAIRIARAWFISPAAGPSPTIVMFQGFLTIFGADAPFGTLTALARRSLPSAPTLAGEWASLRKTPFVGSDAEPGLPQPAVNWTFQVDAQINSGVATTVTTELGCIVDNYAAAIV
jgi:hypothetical protein